MNTNVQPSCQKQQNLITYYVDGEVQINLECILTPDRIVRNGMMLIKVEGTHTDVIKLLGVRNNQDTVYLLIKDMRSKRIHEISQKLDSAKNNVFVWWITSYQFAASKIEDRVIEELKGTVN